MEGREHPEPALLDRFLSGEATLAEKCAVVRHLLGGCPQCAGVLEPIWGPARSPVLHQDLR